MIEMAKSLVKNPASTVSIMTYSKVSHHFNNCGLLSSLALCIKPLVQAKILAIELVEVSLPF